MAWDGPLSINAQLKMVETDWKMGPQLAVEAART